MPASPGRRFLTRTRARSCSSVAAPRGAGAWMAKPATGLSRRAVLVGGIAGLLGKSGASRAGNRSSPEPLTFVLVHGSWQGGWCWYRVRKILGGFGHLAFSPTLTGLGDRDHLVNPSVDVDLHARDVAEMIAFENLRNVVLVGHSYGGLVIAAVAELMPGRLKRLVYLDGLIPDDGQSHMDIVPSIKDSTIAAARQRGAGWLIPPMSAAQLGITDAGDAAWFEERARPQPLATWEQPVRLKSTDAARIRKSFIWCTQFTLGAMAEKARRAGWDVHELPTGHDAMVTMPHQLSQVLITCAQT